MRRVLLFIIESRYGLSETELSELFLSQDDELRLEVFKYHPDKWLIPGIPHHVLTRALMFLKPILKVNGHENLMLYQVKHQRVSSAIVSWTDRILGDAGLLRRCRLVMIERHREMLSDTSAVQVSARSLLDYVHLLTNAGMQEEAIEWLAKRDTFAMFHNGGDYYEALSHLQLEARKLVISRLLSTIGDDSQTLLKVSYFIHQFSFLEELSAAIPRLEAMLPRRLNDSYFLFLIGSSYESMGMYQKAQSIFLSVLSIENISPVYAFGCNIFLAFISEYQGNGADALAYSEAGLDVLINMRNETIKKVFYGIVCLCKAQIYIQKREVLDAEKALAGLDLGNPVSVLSGILYSNLAQLAELKNDFETALDLYHTAEQIYIKLYGASHPQLGAVYNGWGLVCEQAGDMEKALLLYEKSLAIRCAYLGRMHQDLISTLSNLSGCYFCCDRETDAVAMGEWINNILTSIECSTEADMANNFQSQSRIARRDIVQIILQYC